MGQLIIDKQQYFYVNTLWGVYRTIYPLPVELLSFTADINESNVFLKWITASELNNKGFAVERKSKEEWKEIGFVHGNGTTTELTFYEFKDLNVPAGSYLYRLKQIDFDGSISYSESIEVIVSFNYNYKLFQNYPNPFNPETKISFTLASANNVRLSVYDILGNEIFILANENKEAGEHTITFNAAGLSAGVYFYTLKTGEFLETKKLILLK
jgi:hypothetical protein